MMRIPGGAFLIGSDSHYPEEAPARRVRVDPFLIDPTPVTNRAFATFVAATGHRTTAETPPDPRAYPGADPARLVPGSLVFTPPPGPVTLDDPSAWWAFVPGASWRHPLGPGSSLDGLDDHPVVHVSFDDARAYARWAGKSVPREAEWEFAARGGLEGAAFAWGDSLAPDGRPLANYWQGRFPHENTLDDGYLRTSPVGAYPPNGYGLHDMIGNVWEWTADWFGPHLLPDKTKGGCCVPANPRGGMRADSIVDEDGVRIPRKVLKGGSHLCAEGYCQRYRPAARYPQPIDTTTSHVGFRCVRRSGD